MFQQSFEDELLRMFSIKPATFWLLGSYGGKTRPRDIRRWREFTAVTTPRTFAVAALFASGDGAHAETGLKGA